jgi:hypothetical protein
MTLEEALISVWRQAFESPESDIELDGKRFRLGRTRGKGLLIVEFSFDSQNLTAIEQNPQTSSRWAQMARQGKRIMQFSCSGRYFANVAEGQATKYSAWRSLGLPE